jgi:hypothetical protein
LNQAKVQQQSVHTGFHKAGNLAARIFRSRNWADYQSMIESHHQGTAPRLVENPVEPDILPKITQGATPSTPDIPPKIIWRRFVCQFVYDRKCYLMIDCIHNFSHERFAATRSGYGSLEGRTFLTCRR